MNRAALLLGVLVCVASCQTYDFERVIPLAVAQTTQSKTITAKRLKPNVMLLVDNSASMEYPTDPNHSVCQTAPGCGPGNRCPAGCPTRISEMKSAMNTFFTNSATIARFGLTIYPTNAQCAASTNIDIQLPAPVGDDTGTDSTLTANAQQVNGRIQALSPTGGTPTGKSLQFLSTYTPLSDVNDGRDDFILLLTDGLPNCNDMNAKSLCACGTNCTADQNAACACTTANCQGGLCALGCLDEDGAVAAVAGLATKQIKTIVVGFGADLASGSGPRVLNAMAIAGGFPRECPNGTDAECGGQAGSCNASKRCTTAFFQAANGNELAAALAKISEGLGGDPCEFKLDQIPSDSRYLSVVIDNQSVAASSTTWSYNATENKIVFTGALCTRLQTSTPSNPVNVEFRIVEKF